MRYILLFFICLPIICVHSQTIKEFEKDFQEALDPKFSTDKLNAIFENYSSLITPHDEAARLMSGLKGETFTQYPLLNFKNSSLYKNNILSLLNSKNSNQRILAYLVIAAAGDSLFENVLLEKIQTEKEEGNLFWAGMALLYLGTDKTTALFDYLVEHEDFGDAHMVPLYFRLDKDSLQSTAWSRIKSEDTKAKILAVQVLSVTRPDPKTEFLLKEAVRNWEFKIKGYAVYSIKQLKIGNLLDIMKPLLDSTSTRAIALEALANSPTKRDQEYLKTLTAESDSISGDLLNCFFHSTEIENVRFWLKMLYIKKLPYNIFFWVKEQPLLFQDNILTDLQDAIEKTTNLKALQCLVDALKGRTDSRSVRIFCSLLQHPDETVRYWTATALQGNKSDTLKKLIPILLTEQKTRTVSLVKLAIENEINTLHPVFEKILSESPSLDWERSAIEYLSEFPLERDKDIFRDILREDDKDSFIKINAALGLGRIKDINSVDLIIKNSRKEGKLSDLNSRYYLIALGMIKGDKAKAEIESYRNSREQLVREIVDNILKDW